MKWYTHAAVGANLVWPSLLFFPPTIATPLLLVIGAAAALLPDVEAHNAKIHHVWGGVFKIFKGVVAHRMLFHSILAVVVVALITLPLEAILPGFAFMFAGGYLSHILIDGLNPVGVGYLVPFVNKKYCLIPLKYARHPGKTPDTVIFFIALIGLLGFFFYFTSFLAPLYASMSNFNTVTGD